MEKKEAIKIIVKELEFSMSKEQAMRSGIMKHLFEDRKEFDLDIKVEDRVINKTDIEGVHVIIKDLAIISY